MHGSPLERSTFVRSPQASVSTFFLTSGSLECELQLQIRCGSRMSQTLKFSWRHCSGDLSISPALQYVQSYYVNHDVCNKTMEHNLQFTTVQYMRDHYLQTVPQHTHQTRSRPVPQQLKASATRSTAGIVASWRKALNLPARDSTRHNGSNLHVGILKHCHMS